MYIEYGNRLDEDLQEYLVSLGGDSAYTGSILLRELNSDRKALYLISMFARQERSIKNWEKVSNNNWKEGSGRRIIRLINDESRKTNLSHPKSWLPGYIDINSELYRSFIDIFGITGNKGLFAQPAVNEEGFLELRHIGLAQAIQEEKIIADRIRICSACGDIYWAKKSDAKSCGKRKCVESNKYLRKKAKEKTNTEKKEDTRRKWLNKDFSK